VTTLVTDQVKQQGDQLEARRFTVLADGSVLNDDINWMFLDNTNLVILTQSSR
jgi:hypothetical protein